MNNNINPILYDSFLHLKNTMGARIVHRRKRNSSNCIEIVLTNVAIKAYIGTVNTLREAEKCGYWVICRRQNKKGRTTYRGMTVFQLFLLPVHSKKRNEAKHLATAVDVSFEPIIAKKIQKKFARACTCQKKVLPLQPICKVDFTKSNKTYIQITYYEENSFLSDHRRSSAWHDKLQ